MVELLSSIQGKDTSHYCRVTKTYSVLEICFLCVFKDKSRSKLTPRFSTMVLEAGASSISQPRSFSEDSLRGLDQLC